MDKRKSQYECRVYHEHTDSYGVVWHGTYLAFLSQARTELLRSQGILLPELAQQFGVLFAIKSVSLDYHQPAVLDDVLMIETSLLAKKQASLVFEQTISCLKTKESLLCKGLVIVVCTDLELKPKRIPVCVKEALCEY